MRLSDKQYLQILFLLIAAVGGAVYLTNLFNEEREANARKKMAVKDKEIQSLKRAQSRTPRRERLLSARGPVEIGGPVDPLAARFADLTSAQLAEKIAELRDAGLLALDEEDGDTFLLNLRALLAIGKPAYPEAIKFISLIRKDPSLLFRISSRPRDFQQMLSSESLYLFYIDNLTDDRVTDPFRAQTIRMLARTGGSDTIPHLVRLLERPTDDDVTYATIDTLGALRATEAIPLFRKMLGDAELSETARVAILRSLGRIGGEQAFVMLQGYTDAEFDEPTREAALGALVRTGADEAVPVAIDLLSTGTPQMIRTVLRSVGRGSRTLARNDEIQERVVALATTDPDPELRAAAFFALRSYSPDLAVPTILKGIEDQPGNVRRMGLRVLAAIPAQESTEAIQTIAETDGDESIQKFARRILTRRAARGGRMPIRRVPPNS